MKYFSPVFWLFKLLAILKASVQFQVAEDDEVPSHYFTIIEQLVKSGKDKGKSKYIVNLVLPPWCFKRKVDAPCEGKKATFSCIRCEAEGFRLYAKCVKNFSEDSKPSYTLVQWPDTKSHKCLPSTTAHLVKSFMDRVYSTLRVKPWMSVAGIFKEQRSIITATLNEDEKIVFLSEVPRFQSCNANLYRYRSQFIPRQPVLVVSNT